MTDPDSLQEHATHIVLHAWIAAYLAEGVQREPARPTASLLLSSQAQRLRESAIALQAALEKMRAANEKLAARMAEHKAFFAKYEAP